MSTIFHTNSTKYVVYVHRFSYWSNVWLFVTIQLLSLCTILIAKKWKFCFLWSWGYALPGWNMNSINRRTEFDHWRCIWFPKGHQEWPLDTVIGRATVCDPKPHLLQTKQNTILSFTFPCPVLSVIALLTSTS